MRVERLLTAAVAGLGRKKPYRLGLWGSSSLNRAFFAKGGTGKKDYYSNLYLLEILGVEKKAGKSDIKKAFAKLAQELHPDKNPSPDAKERFKDITE